MGVRAIPAGDPANIRALVQTRYDSYMSGRRMRLGMAFDGLEEILATDTAEARDEAYDAFADRWPQKSHRLMKAVAREFVFQQTCLMHHNEASGPILREMDEATEGVELRTPFVYISGYGRNACLTTIMRNGERRQLVSHLGIAYASMLAIGAGTGGKNAPLMIDPDFGLGTLSGPTPELLDTQTGSPHLAAGAWEGFTTMLKGVGSPLAA